MTDPNVEIIRLSSRISALEKANRRWKVGGLLLLVFLVGTALLTGFRAYAQHSTQRPFSGTVVAHEFVLMSSHGRVLGRMGVVKGEPVLQFYNPDGQLWWFAPPKTGWLPVHGQTHHVSPK